MFLELLIDEDREFLQKIRFERSEAVALENLRHYLDERVRCATRELLQSNEHLDDANRAKDQFLAAMSHELRTPLTAITGAVRILRSVSTTESKRETIMEMLERNAATLKHLLDDLLDCSRIASGKLSLELTPVNLNDCVAAAVETMRTKASDAKVELRTWFPETPSMVLGHDLRLQQIAWNLIDNAIKFTPSGGQVAISILRDHTVAELLVWDSGGSDGRR